MEKDNKNKNEQNFSGLRKIFFPIHSYELKKFIPLAFLFLFISYNYSIIRTAKDLFILGKSGAEAIYFLKAFGVTPAIFLFTIIYSIVSKNVGRQGSFNFVMGYFFIFFLLYIFLIIPNLDSLAMDNIADGLNEKMPNLKGLWSAIRYWHISWFYISAEIWGGYSMGVLFWTFANEIVNLQQAKRFYGLLIAVGANVGATVAGLSLKYILKGDPTMTLYTLLGVLLLTVIVYNYLSRAIAANPKDYQIAKNSTSTKKKKPKLSFMESLKFLFSSPYLMLIAVLVLSYGVSISLFESIWKDRLKLWTGGDLAMMAQVTGNQLIYIGVITIIMVMFVSPWIKKKSWTVMAFMTPFVFLVGTIAFFIFLSSTGGSVDTTEIGIKAGSLYYSVLVGLANVIFIKAAKYAFFDPSKEMAYIPLDEESKIRGKAAVDGVGSRLGKSLGSFLLTVGILPITKSIDNAKFIIAGALLVILIIWIVALINLGVRFKKVTSEHNTVPGK